MSHEVCEARARASVSQGKAVSEAGTSRGADACGVPVQKALFEERCAILDRALMRQSLHRELLYKGLAFCQTRRTLAELEGAIGAFPEFSQATQSPYHFIGVLVEAGGLVRLPLDDEGGLIDPIQLEGLSEDARDDLVADEAFETTEIGRVLVRRHAPRARLVELMETEPQREDVYGKLLSFCAAEPRSYVSIAAFLESDPVLYRKTSDPPSLTQPSVFVDKLQRAAGLVWQGGWMTTEEGKEFLAERKGRRV